MVRPQVVRVGNNTSPTLILNTGAPQGYVLSPLLYSLFNHDCTARDDSNTIIQFDEVRDLAVWCQDNNLSLNVIKTKGMIVDYRKKRTEHAAVLIDGAAVEQVESLKFLGVHITNKLTLSKHTKTIMKRVRQNLFSYSITLRSKKIWHGSSDPQKVLQLHHQEHPDWLHHCLVWQL
jgi:hypothetical protein